jgi:uncharacterized delta-60 repeat protein
MIVGVGGGRATTVVVQTDDKIVVAGSAQPSKSSASQAMVLRLNEDGSLDASFGSGGIAWVSPLGTKVTGNFNAVTLQSDGKIVAVGSQYGGAARFISRLNANGALDMTFAGKGYLLWTAEGSFNNVTTQWVGPDERIVVVGSTRDSLSHPVSTIWRFTGAGALDADFGGTGVVQTSFHVEDGRTMGDNFKDLAIDPTNRIVAVGLMSYYLVPGDISTVQSQVVFARYDVNGNPDPSFGSDPQGRVWAPLSAIGKDVAKAVAVHDGRIVAVGQSGDQPTAGSLWRFNDDGTVDGAFGNGGWVQHPIADGARLVYFLGMALQADGGIICGGTIAMEGTPQINYLVLARFWQ